MPVRHAFVSGKAAPTDATLVGGPDWDAGHLFIPTNVPINHIAVTWTDQPAGVTEFLGNVSRRAYAVLPSGVDFRFYCIVMTASAAAGAVLYPQFSTDAGGTWADLQSGGTTTAGQIDLTTTGSKVTGWIALAAGAKTDPVLLRTVGKTGGTATGDPQFGGFGLIVR